MNEYMKEKNKWEEGRQEKRNEKRKDYFLAFISEYDCEIRQ